MNSPLIRNTIKTDSISMTARENSPGTARPFPKNFPADPVWSPLISIVMAIWICLWVADRGRNSYLLENKGGRFIDVTDQKAPGLRKIGLVNAALWTDANNDYRPDLLLVGEWMPITVFLNTESGLRNATADLNLEKTVGWWNSLQASDLNQDGKMDFVLGNHGINSRYRTTSESPLSIYVNDFGHYGNRNAVITVTESGKEYPIHPKDDIVMQLPELKKRYLLYQDYAKASIDELFSRESLKNAEKHTAHTFSSSLLISNAKGGWDLRPLAVEAQFAPVFGSLIGDYDADGRDDILLIGNDYSAEVINGRYDAFDGLMLKGDGSGNFKPVASDFFVGGDGKSLVEMLSASNERIILASQNNGPVIALRPMVKGKAKIIRVKPNDAFAVFTLGNGKKIKKELYYGAGYLSGSGRHLCVPIGAVKAELVDFKGASRTIVWE
jgi:hypothetical protein